MNKKQLEKFLKEDTEASGIEFKRVSNTRRVFSGTEYSKSGKTFEGYEIYNAFSKPEFARLKLIEPIGDMKYVSKTGSGSAFYISPMFPDTIPNGLVVITEGEKKADKLCQEGVPSIGLLGPWGWSENKEMIQELVDFLNRGDVEEIVIVWDNDAYFNPHFAKASLRLSKEILSQSRKKAKFLHLPVMMEDQQ
jgi:hypothetical protein